MLRRIDRILLRVPGLQSAVKYYRDVLGLKLAREESNLASFRLNDGETELVLHTDRRHAQHLHPDACQQLLDRRARRDQLLI